MDLGIIHNTIKDLLRKQSLTVPTDMVIDEFLDLSQLEIFEDYYNIYGVSDDSHDSLAPFKIRLPFTTAADGKIAYPADYHHLISVYTITYDNNRQQSEENKVQFVNEDKLQSALKSQVRPISVTKPIATSNSSAIVLFPATIHAVALLYFKRPPAPKYVYTQSGRTVAYSPTTSTQLLWADPYIPKIVAKTLGYLGMSIDDTATIQFSELKQKEEPSI